MFLCLNFQPGSSPKWVKSKRRKRKREREKERKRERLKVGNNNGLASATSGGARKPPGPKENVSLPDAAVVTAAGLYCCRLFMFMFLCAF